MRHLKNLVTPLSKKNIAGLTFHFAPDHEKDLTALVRDFISHPGRHAALDVPEETRGVFLLEGDHKWVLKHNKLVHWKKQLRNYLGLRKVFGLHDLTNEFINLSVVSGVSNSAPEVAAYGYKSRFPFLKEEYLVVKYFEDHKTLDEVLKVDPGLAREILPKVFDLFQKMLSEGFVHLDPHPKNILIGADGSLRLIDFECCAHSVIDHDFSLGFLMGYLYRFWISRYITLQDYRDCCNQYLQDEQDNIDMSLFKPVFERFIYRKVSRTVRYNILTCEKSQEKFKQEMLNKQPDSIYDVESC